MKIDRRESAESPDAAEILAGLECARRSCVCHASSRKGHGLTHCPAHDDQTPSLSITEDRQVLWKCHAGCSQDAVRDALYQQDLWPRNGSHKVVPVMGPTVFAEEAKVISTTDYQIRDRHNQLVAIHRRQDLSVIKPETGKHEKRLKWLDRNGRVSNGAIKSTDLLYGLELLDLNPEIKSVLVVEGEKAADALRPIFLALGTVCGASTTPTEAVLANLEALRRVTLWPDNSTAGRAHMAKIAAILHRLGIEVWMVTWPDSPVEGDAADLIDRLDLPNDLGKPEKAEAARLALRAAIKTEPYQLDIEPVNDPEPPRRPPPIFPVARLPGAAADYVNRLHEGGLPMEYVGPAALAALAAAVGGLRALVVQEGGWTVRAILWVLLVGRQGTGKSPALINIRRPFDEISTGWSATFKLEHEVWSKRSKEDKNLSPEPVHRRLQVDDTTLEALAKTLADNPDGVFLCADEARALISGLGQYKRQTMADRAKFLSLWTASPLFIDRVSGGLIYVPNPIVTILAGIQDELLSVIEGPDGMRSRWLISRYEGGPLPVRKLNSIKDQDEGWQRLIRSQVYKRDQAMPFRRFSLEAEDLFQALRRTYLAEQSATETPAAVEDWLAKAPVQLAKIALNLAVVDRPEELLVNANHVEAAADLVSYFLAQIRTLPSGAENLMLPRYQRDQDQAVDALAAFARRPPDKRVTRRQVQQAHVGGARTPVEVDALIQRYGEANPGCAVSEEASGNKTIAVYAPGHQPR
jgi:Protein of unknown function (DUF3987)